MANSKEFDAWLRNQPHKPEDKITNLQRLTSKFLPPPGVTTWGEWYELKGVTPTPKKEKKAEKKPVVEKVDEVLSAGDIENKVNRLQIILDKQRESLKSLDLKDPDFKPLEAAIRKTESELKTRNKELKEAVKVEKRLKAEEELAIAQEDIQYAEAGGDPAEIKKARNTLNKAQATATKLGVKEKEAEPAVTEEPKLGPDGKPVVPKPAGGKGGVTPKPAKDKVVAPSDEEQRTSALDVAATDFSLPETIFKNVPSLNRILKKYVDEDWTEAKLRKAIRDDNWYRKNSAEIKARYVQKFNYDDLVATGQATGSTDYEMQISQIERKLAKRAAQIGSAAASDPNALRQAAENLYITNRSEDNTYIDDFLSASIKPIAGMIGGKVTEGYSGEALKNYNVLVKAARDNGFQVSDILPGGTNEQQVLQGIAAGTIDVNRVVADARKMAAQGQPQYVRDLLAQGYDLSQVFQPYRQTMANVLEIGDPDQIDLNDPLLRTAITDKGDMNLYDFKKALRQDNRWQYTEQAKSDVSNAALQVLRDFGFQG
jgi:hypothetical protein